MTHLQRLFFKIFGVWLRLNVSCGTPCVVFHSVWQRMGSLEPLDGVSACSECRPIV